MRNHITTLRLTLFLCIMLLTSTHAYAGDAASIPLLHTLTPQGDISALAWSPDSTQLALASFGVDEMVSLWDIESGEMLNSFHETTTVTSLSWHPDGAQLAVFGSSLIIWDTANQLPLTLAGIPDEALLSSTGSVAWNSDGTRLLFHKYVPDEEAVFVHVWDGASETVTFIGNPLVTAGISAQWQPASNVLLSIDNDIVEIWDTDSGELVADITPQIGALLGSDDYYIVAAHWNSTGSTIAIGLGAVPSAPDIYFWDVETQAFSDAPLGSVGDLTTFAWHPAQDYVAIGYFDGTIGVWDVATSAVIATLAFDEPQDNAIKQVEWSPDGSYLVATDYFGNAFIWDVSSLNP